jgi:hypothetical protein
LVILDIDWLAQFIVSRISNLHYISSNYLFALASLFSCRSCGLIYAVE